MNLPELKVSLKEFAILASQEMPLASSLACLLLAYGETSHRGELEAIDGREQTFAEWANSLEDAFDHSAKGHSYRELQSNVLKIAQLNRVDVSKVMN